MNRDQNTPSALVTVDKRFGRQVLVGIVDSNRQLTNGFSSDWPATINYRTLRHGSFSVLVGTRAPVEVRVMMDGKLLCEHILDPLPAPSLSGTRSDVTRKLGELINQPQPFFISSDSEGANLAFVADERTDEEHLRLQLNPEPINPVNSPAHMHLGEVPSIFQAKIDIPAPAKSIPAQVDQTGTVVSRGHEIDAPLPDSWAPSSGLLVIGIRMIQTQQEGEPTMPPDGFEYVLFQLNTWENHARIRANLHSRIKLGPRIKFPEIVDGEKPQDYQSATPTGTCGHSHGHNPRRFK